MTRAAELAVEGVGPDVLRRLERRGLVKLAELERRREVAVEAVGSDPAPVRLTSAQSAGVERVVAALEAGGGGELLLHGVTGSGKTEVYLAAAEAALARGRSAIVLVPEIALTPQTVHRFRRRLGETVAILHSGLAAGERYDEWRRLAGGEARVCVRPRCAVLA